MSKKQKYIILSVVTLLAVIFISFLIALIINNQKNPGKQAETLSYPISKPISLPVSDPALKKSVSNYTYENFDKLKQDFKVVYLENNEIFLSNEDKSKVLQVTNTNNSVQDFRITKDYSKIYFTVSDQEKFKEISTEAYKLARPSNAPGASPLIKQDKIDDYKNIPLKLLSLDLKTNKIETKVDYTKIEVIRDDLSAYYVKPFERIYIKLISINDDGSKILYSRNGVWVYDGANRNNILVDESKRVMLGDGFISNSLLSISQNMEAGWTEDLYKLINGQYIKIQVNGIELTSAAYKSNNHEVTDDQVIAIENNEDFLTSRSDYVEKKSSVYRINSSSGDAIKLFEINLNEIHLMTYNGRKLLFQAKDSNGIRNIYSVDLDGNVNLISSANSDLLNDFSTIINYENGVVYFLSSRNDSGTNTIAIYTLNTTNGEYMKFLESKHELNLFSFGI